MTTPSRVQLEIAAVAAGALVLLYLYRSYLDRSLELQAKYADELLAQREREYTAGSNGHGPNGWTFGQLADALQSAGYQVSLVMPPAPADEGEAPA